MTRTLHTPHGTLHYEIFGQGAPILLHQGLGRTSRHWLGFDKMLAEHYQVIIFDTRGLGRSRDLHTPLNLSVFAFAEDARDLLVKLKIEKAHILGVSLGGMVSIAFAERFPEYAKSLIVINSSIGGNFTPRISPLGLLSLAVGGIAPRLTSMALSYTLVGRSLGKVQRQALQREWTELDRIDQPDKQVILRHILAALKFSKKLQFHRISCPSLVLYGSEDLFVPTKNSHNIYKLLPQAQIREIIGGGHEMYLEKPEQIIKELNSFIRSYAPD